MDVGISLGETVLIMILVLVFFGSDKLPSIMRELGRIIAMVRAKANEFTTEIQRAAVETQRSALEEGRTRKAALRKAMLDMRRNQPESDALHKSKAIGERLLQSDQWAKATSVFLYLSLPEEARTDELILQALAAGKRVAVPVINAVSGSMETCEIHDLNEVEPGPMGIRRPKAEYARRFFKSDIELVVCPGVAFDNQGGRLGFGKGYYDRYLRDLRGKIPIVAIAFDFQITAEPLPFSHQDVPMDQIFTETRIIGVATLLSAGKKQM